MVAESHYFFCIISVCDHLMPIILVDELLSECFKFMLFFKDIGIIIKYVCRAVHSCHFGTSGYWMVEINVSGPRLYEAIFTVGTGTLISAIRTLLPWLKRSLLESS